MDTLKTKEDLNAWLTRSETEPVVLYKHSATCPFSARAQVEVAELKHDMPIATLVVQYAADISKEAASVLGVQHETPQVIILSKGKAKQSMSHGKITKAAIQAAMNAVSSD